MSNTIKIKRRVSGSGSLGALAVGELGVNIDDNNKLYVGTSAGNKLTALPTSGGTLTGTLNAVGIIASSSVTAVGLTTSSGFTLTGGDAYFQGSGGVNFNGGPVSFSATAHISSNVTIKRDNAYNLNLYRPTTGATNASFLSFDLNNDATSAEKITYGLIGARIVDHTDGSEDGELVFRTMLNGTLATRMTLENDGNLEISGSKLTFGYNDQYLQVGTGTIALKNSSNSVLWSSANQLSTSGGTLTGELTSQKVAPSANNTYSSGGANYRWTNVYSVLGNFSGDLTVGDGTGNTKVIIDGDSASNKGAYVSYRKDGTQTSAVGYRSSILGGTSNNLILYTSSGDIDFYNGGTVMTVTSSGLTVSGTANFGGSYTNFGGGYGATGVSITSAGNIQANGTLTVDTGLSVTGSSSFQGAAFSSIITATGASIGSTSVNKTLSVVFARTGTNVTQDGLSGGGAGKGLMIYNSTEADNVYANLDFRARNADGRIAYQYTNATNKGDFHFITDNTGSPAIKMTLKNEGNLLLGDDTDAYANIGRARIGHNEADNDYASFSHRDSASGSSYALMQSAAGATFLNSASNQQIYFRVNNSTKMSLSAAGTVTVNNNLTVAGSCTFAALSGTTANFSGILTVQSGSLLRRYISGWTNATTHDVLYNGWHSSLGDYIYLKAQGNSTANHGAIVITDGLGTFFGHTDVETGGITNSSTAPLTTTHAKIGATSFFNGDVTIGSTITLKNSGNVSYIQDSQADLRIESNTMTLRSLSQENYITCALNGAVSLYYDSAKKFETTSSGATISGNLSLTNSHLNLGHGYSLQWADSHERIEATNSTLKFFTNNGQQMTLNGSSLGIGNDAPTSKLDVSGEIKTHSTTDKISNGAMASTSSWTNYSGGNNIAITTSSSPWRIVNGVASYDDSGGGTLAQESVFATGDSGKTFKLTFTIQVGSSGNASIWIGNKLGSGNAYTSSNGYVSYGNGTHTIEIVPTDTTLGFWCNTGGGNFNIDNISCHEQHSRIGDTATFNGKVSIIGKTGYLLDVQQTTVNWTARFENNGGAYGVSIDTANNIANNVYNLACYTPAGMGVFVTNQGRLAVGTSAPLGTFHCNDGTIGGQIYLTKTSGGASSTLGRITFGNTNIDSNLASIGAIQDGASNSARLEFLTQATGGNTIERMRIASNGDISFLDGAGSATFLWSRTNGRLVLSKSDYQLQVQNGANIWFARVPSSGNFAIHRNGVGDILSMGTGGTDINAHTHFRPYNNNQYTCGTSANRWSNVYSSAGDFINPSSTDSSAADSFLNIFKTAGSGGGSRATLRVGYDAANCFQISRIRNDANIYLNTRQGGSNMIFQTQDTERFRITDSGHLVMQSGKVFHLDGGGDTYIYENSANSIGFVTGGAARAFVNNTGFLVKGTSTIAELRIDNSSGHKRHIDFSRSSTGNSYATARIQVLEPGATHTGSIGFWTSNASGGPNLVEAMRITQDQKIGIGTTAPDSKLEIAGGDYNTSLKIKGGSGNTGIQFEDSGGTTDGYIYAAADSVGFLDSGSSWTIQCKNDDYIRFATNGNNERMRITSTGVGIGGTTAPAMTLDVYRSVTGNWLSRIHNIATSGNSSGLLVRIDETGSAGFAFATLVNGSYKLAVKPNGNTGFNTSTPDSQIHSLSSGTNYAAHFQTNSTTPYGVRISVNSSGTSAGYPLFRVDQNGSHYFSISSGGTVTCDANLKANYFAFRKAGADIGAYFSLTNQAGDSSSNDLTITAAQSTNSVVLRSSAKIQMYTYASSNWQKRFEISNAGAITFNSEFTFPTADGSANQVLKTNGSGTLSWADQSGGGSGSGTVSSSSVTSSTTNGNIAVYTDSTTVKQAPRLFYNGSDHSLTVNKTSPGNENLHVVGDAQITTRLGVGTSPNSSYTAFFSGNIYSNGDIGGYSKSFKIPHPTKEGMNLRHSSLEGPEIGVYQRGEVQGDTIELPDYWAGLVRDGTVTVQLTPKGSYQKLFVISASNIEIKIGEADGNAIDCYYTVYGERADIDRYEVEYEGQI